MSPAPQRHGDRADGVPPLVTDRLELPAVTPATAAAVLDGRVDRLPDGLVAGPGWPTDDTVDGMRMSWDGTAAPVSGGTRLVVVRETRQVVGDLGWKGGPGPDGTVEIGYGLAVRSRGRGYGTEAVGAFADWALREEPDGGGATALTAEVLAENTASRRLLERIGFDLDRVDGRVVWYRRTR